GRVLGGEANEGLGPRHLLAVARQREEGPAGLYGPYGGRNPLVLIHAPLYYRVAALAAWPITLLGVGAVPASLVAGRLLSALGMVTTLVATFRLARLDGAAPAGGWWAALLLAATPGFGGLPFEVRPDMLGIGLQTTGALIFLAALEEQDRRRRRLAAAFVCFALAACIKQQFVVTPAVAALILTAASARGAVRWQDAARP